MVQQHVALADQVELVAAAFQYRGQLRVEARELQLRPVQPVIDQPGTNDVDRAVAAVHVGFFQLEVVDQHRGDRFRAIVGDLQAHRSEEHTSELQSLMRISYAVFCLKKKRKK